MEKWTEKYVDEIKAFMEKCFYKEVTETEKEIKFTRKLMFEPNREKYDVITLKIDKKYESVKKEICEYKTGHIFPIGIDFDEIKYLNKLIESIVGE